MSDEEQGESVKPDWVIIGASVAGSSHIRKDVPCQDAHTYAILGGGVAVVAVADGMGTAGQAGIGASLAVGAALNAAVRQLTGSGACPQNEASWVLLLRSCFASARSYLEEEAQMLNVSLRELGTTLLLAVAAPGWLAVAHIGDGAIVVQDDRGDIVTVAAPQSGEYANETYPLTLPQAMEVAEFNAWPVETIALALFTDGLQRLALHLPDFDPHPPFFEPLFRQLPGLSETDQVERAGQALADFLASERVASLSDDDLTLVLIGRRDDTGSSKEFDTGPASDFLGEENQRGDGGPGRS